MHGNFLKNVVAQRVLQRKSIVAIQAKEYHKINNMQQTSCERFALGFGVGGTKWLPLSQDGESDRSDKDGGLL